MSKRKTISMTVTPENHAKLTAMKPQGMSLGAFIEKSVLQDNPQAFDSKQFPPPEFTPRDAAIYMLANMDAPKFSASQIAEWFGLSRQFVDYIKSGKTHGSMGIKSPLALTIPFKVVNKNKLDESALIQALRAELHKSGFTTIKSIEVDNVPQVQFELVGFELRLDAIDRLRDAIKGALDSAIEQVKA